MTTRTPDGVRMAWLLEESHQDPHDECVLWPFSVDRKGYGRAKYAKATHVALAYAGRPWHPPLGHLALHSCDSPACVNPRHLDWGTAAENTRQMVERGRDRFYGKGSTNEPSDLEEVRRVLA
jgi:hypothetical protein